MEESDSYCIRFSTNHMTRDDELYHLASGHVITLTAWVRTVPECEFRIGVPRSKWNIQLSRIRQADQTELRAPNNLM